MAVRITQKKAEAGALTKVWNGARVESMTLVGSDAAYGLGVIVGTDEGTVRLPDASDVLGAGATTGEDTKFVGIILGREKPISDAYLSGEVARPTVATPKGRGEKDFYKEFETVSILRVGDIGVITEQAVVKGDPVFMRIGGADTVTSGTAKVLGGFRKDADTAGAVAITGAVYSQSAGAFEPVGIELRIN
jgi:hypothetical protein